jgi:hypothetical protein
MENRNSSIEIMRMRNPQKLKISVFIRDFEKLTKDKYFCRKYSQKYGGEVSVQYNFPNNIEEATGSSQYNVQIGPSN